MAQAKPIDYCIEGVGIVWQRLCVSLLKPDGWIPRARQLNLCRREIDPDSIGAALGGSSGRAGDRPEFSDDVNWDNRKFSADELGGVSLSTYSWDFAPYVTYMKRRLRDHIYPPPAFMQMGAISGEVVIRFKVYPDGSTRDIEIVGYKGHQALVETSLNAVKASSPFRPLPERFPDEFLGLTWTFIYSILR